MKRTWLFLAATSALLASTPTLAGDRSAERDVQRTENISELRALPSGGRWVAALDDRAGRQQLLVMDLQRDAVYQLAEFSGQDLGDAHWVGENRLEVELGQGSAFVVVEESTNAEEPTFRIVTTALHGRGATEVDYFSPPLLAFYQPQDELRAVLAAAAGQDAQR